MHHQLTVSYCYCLSHADFFETLHTMWLNNLSLFVLSCYFVGICQPTEVWVVPHTEYPYPATLPNISQCLTLSDLISKNLDRNFSVSVIYFLPGVHKPTKTGWITANFKTNISLVGDSQRITVINCLEYKIGFLLDDIDYLKVSHLTLIGCGYDSTDTPSGILEENNYRNESRILNSIATLLFFNIKILYIDSVQLYNNVGFGLVVIEPTTTVSVNNSSFCGANPSLNSLNMNRGNVFILVNWNTKIVFRNSELCNGSGSSEPLIWSGKHRERYISGGATIWQTTAHTCYIYFYNVTFRCNKAHKGGGMYLTSMGSQQDCQGDLIVHIRDCTFENNSAKAFGGAVHRDYHFYVQCLSFVDTEYSGMYVDSSAFIHNFAALNGGGVHNQVQVTLQNGQDDVTAFTFNITNCSFSYNRAREGAAVYLALNMKSEVFTELIPIGNNATLLTDVLFTLQQVTFKNNLASVSGAVSLKTIEDSFDSLITIILRIQESDFSCNSANQGSALSIDSRKSKMSGNSVLVTESQFTDNFCHQDESFASLSVIHLSEVQYMLLKNVIIENNQNCRAVYSKMSLIEIKENVMIRNHSSQFGAAIYLDCNPLSNTHRTSQLLLNNDVNTTLYLSHNHALFYGGGIYVTTGCSDPELCFYKLKMQSSQTTAAVVLENNTAETGASSIYSGYLEHCATTTSASNIEIFKSVFKIYHQLTPSVVASQPYKACVCMEKPYSNHDCQFEYNVSMFPGQTVKILMVGASDFNNTFPSIIRASIDSNQHFAELLDVQKTQQIGLWCKNLSYTISTPLQNVSISMTLQVDKAFGSGQAIAESKKAKVKVYIKHCPFGFKLNVVNRECSCVEHLRNSAIECDIKLVIIRKASSLIWLGNYSGEIAIHYNCPFDYCKQDFFNVDPYNQQEQCNFNRSGVLCGSCRPGLSLVLGTSQCKQCSDLYLFILIAFALAGVVLVLILLKCDLTVSTGMLNGLIFYANIIQANHSLYFPNPSTANSFSYVLGVLTAWLNLDLGIEICLSSSLTQYSRTWLQFIFPIYIWIMVGALIVVSRYSIAVSKFTGSNTVSVLATLFLLSYAKVLRATLNSVSATIIQTANTSHLVWLEDGSYSFIGWPHVLLFLFALLMLLFYVIPFTFLLLFTPLLQAVSNYRFMNWVNTLAPFIDAYQGPYKKKMRFWTGLMLLVRLLLFAAFAGNILGNPELNVLLIIIVTSVLLSIWWKLGKIYKRKINNFLEMFFLLNLSFISAITLYLNRQPQKNTAQEALICIAVGSALVVFILLLLYKPFLIFSKTTLGKCAISTLKNISSKKKDTEEIEVVQENLAPIVRQPTCTIVDIKENRVPLLTSNEECNVSP